MCYDVPMDSKPLCSVAVSPDVHRAVRAVSDKTGIKIRSLVEKALKAAYPISRANKRSKRAAIIE